MGKEVTCQVAYSGGCAEAKVLLETDSVVLRAPFRRTLALKSLTRVEVVGEVLVLSDQDECFSLNLGSRGAASWAKAILHPPTLLDKLGLKTGMSVLVKGLSSQAFLEGHEPSTSEVGIGPFDLVFFGAELSEQLLEVQRIMPRLSKKGAIWIVFPRGNKSIPEVEVIMIGRSFGLTDTKVCRFSDTQTALRFVAKR